MSLAAIQALLTARRGIDPAALSRVGTESAVRRRMRATGCADAAAYARRAARETGELERLVALVLVHETSFFRYPASFDLLVREARARLSGDAGGPFRVHCVGSSTGEEPASVVMALREAGLAPERLRVDASDVSPEAVARARAGLYRARAARRLPAATRARWFRPQGDDVLLAPEVVARVRHHEADALAPDFARRAPACDAVFCRNLLIYLVPDARRRLLERLQRMLRPGGLLFVGHAEVAAAREAGLALVPPAEAFACRRPLAPVPPRPARSPRAAPPAPRVQPPPGPRPPVPCAAAGDGAAVLGEATRLADAGRLAEARRALLDGIAAGPVSADHYHLLALVESAQGRDEASEDALRRALYLDPHHAPSLMQLALLVETRGEGGRARRLRARAARGKGGDRDA